MTFTTSDAEPFLGIDPAILAAIIGALVTVLAACLSALVVVWQIGRQARSAIEQNRDNERLKLKLKIYEEALAACAEETDANIAFTTYARLFLSGAQMIKLLNDNGQNFAPPVARWPELLRLFGEAKSKTIEFVCFVERWGIIDPRLDVFKLAFNAGLFQADQAWNSYSSLAMKLMPVEHPQTNAVFPWDIPTVAAMTELERLTMELCGAFSELAAFTSDFQVEAQNLLLGELFENQVTPRQPIDPNSTVITLARAEQLRDFFGNQTPWAAHTREVRTRVREQVEARAAIQPEPSQSEV